MGRDHVRPQEQGRHVAISIHSPRMGRDVITSKRWTHAGISIHSPRMGRDSRFLRTIAPSTISIHSPRMGRDNYAPIYTTFHPIISIHSPRMGRDMPTRTAKAAAPDDFNPLSPHGERPLAAAAHKQITRFQSTLPAWGETNGKQYKLALLVFQSTLPAWGETRESPIVNGTAKFQSTLPAWGETLYSSAA